MPQIIVNEGDGCRDRGISAYRSLCDAGDSVDLSLPLTATTANPAASVPTVLRSTLGRTTLYVGSSFVSASATAVLTCVLFQIKTDGTYALLPALQTATATASATKRDAAAGRYVGELLSFDLAGATHYEVRCANPSGTDNCSLTAWEV